VLTSPREITLKFTVTATLLAALLSSAQAEVVQQQYTATITHFASPIDSWPVLNGLTLQTGQTVTGLLSYDNAMVGGIGNGFFGDLAYQGTPLTNYITVNVEGRALVSAPSTSDNFCSPVQLVCISNSPPTFGPYDLTTPVVVPAPNPLLRQVITRSADGKNLTLSYSLPTDNATSTLSIFGTPVRAIGSVELNFDYLAPLTGTGLPSQFDLGAVRFAGLTLNLKDGTGVFAQVQSISAAVPEASTVWTFGLGLAAMAGLLRARRQQA
jgi:hypothetical protein